MRTFSLWVFDRRERLFEELAAEVSVLWTVDGVSLKARLDYFEATLHRGPLTGRDDVLERQHRGPQR